MDDFAIRGDLAGNPFARVLAGIGKRGLTGRLLVRGPGGDKTFSFDRGDLVLESGAFDEKGLLRFLLTTGEADLIGLGRVEDEARRTGSTLVRALAEQAGLPPSRLWPALASFLTEEAFSFFDREDAEFEFQETAALAGRALIGSLAPPALVLEGVRRMANTGLIARHLPAADAPLRRGPTARTEGLGLALHERYVLGLLDSGTTLAGLLDASDIGEEGTRRALFAFLCLGLASPASPKPKTGRLAADRTPAEIDRLFAAFNNRCSFIFKYVSKAVGPVALSIIEKALDEVRGRLDPVFQGLELLPDGRIELRSSLRVNMTIGGEDSRRSLLRSMDEILMAEVLAVKKTLGPADEASLIRSLEKMGEGA
jgi:hypothetical protein